MEWGILIDPLVDRYMFEGSLIQEDLRQVTRSVGGNNIPQSV